MPVVALVVIALVELGIAVLLFERWRSMAPPHERPARRRTRMATARAADRPTAPAPRFRLAGEAMRITLDIEVDDPNRSVVRRLVHDAAMRALDRDPTAHEVVVHDRRGAILGRVLRPEPLKGPAPSEPMETAPRQRGRVPRVVGGKHIPRPTISHDDVALEELHVEGRPLARRFELPESVIGRLRREDDEVELVRAILDAAGLRPRAQGDVIVCGDRAVIVIGPHLPPGRTSEALSRAYLRFVETRATSGLCISFTHLDQTEVRRRELLAPSLRHVTSQGVQRMADAVALGADPLAFAAGPVLARA